MRIGISKKLPNDANATGLVNTQNFKNKNSKNSRPFVPLT